jgi:hypothetical protein
MRMRDLAVSASPALMAMFAWRATYELGAFQWFVLANDEEATYHLNINTFRFRNASIVEDVQYSRIEARRL